MPIPPMMMKTIGEKQICAKRGGVPFVEAIRPVDFNQCPVGTSPCNPDASPENILCVKEDEECPITTAYIVKAEDVSKVPHERTKLPLSDNSTEYYVVFGKNTDDLPVMEMQLIPMQANYAQF